MYILGCYLKWNNKFFGQKRLWKKNKRQVRKMRFCNQKLADPNGNYFERQDYDKSTNQVILAEIFPKFTDKLPDDDAIDRTDIKIENGMVWSFSFLADFLEIFLTHVINKTKFFQNKLFLHLVILGCWPSFQ